MTITRFDQTYLDTLCAQAGASPRLRLYASTGVLRDPDQTVAVAHRMLDAGFEATATTADGKKVSLPAWDINAIIDAAKVTLVQPGATRVLALPVRGFDHLKTVEVKLRLRGPG